MGVRFSVALKITSQLSSDEISEYLNLKATDFANKGDFLHKSTKKREETVWILRSDLSKENPLEEHMEFILSLMEARKAELISLSDNGSYIELFCFYSTEKKPGAIILNKYFLTRLSGLPIEEVVFDVHIKPNKG